MEVIIEGLDGLSEWVHDRTHQDTNIIADLISDCGFIEQHITKSSSYYIVVGNVYLNEVKCDVETDLLDNVSSLLSYYISNDGFNYLLVHMG
ncbi:hypothetical protein Bca52824_008029 [Brassica carinata]|uniref:Uncharacterized protein n=1 Tax=Brassica carinata TaxID=52824 RepID=A0A8X7W8Z6_BRACI|nr:hypothetical protein Bca52824_008029 [Brassica carinata]